MPAYNSFDDEAISSALEAAKRPYQETDIQAVREISLTARPLNFSAGCLSLVTRNNQVCLNLPLGLGSTCIPIPFHIPDGTVAQACIDICTIWGIPTGACLRVSAEGQQIARQCFGFGC